MFLRPPPHVKAPDEIVIVASAGVEGSLSYAEYRDYRAQNHVLSGLAGYTFEEFGLSHGDATDEVQAYVVTPNYFSVLGVSAAVGRMFDASAGEAASETAEAVLSHTFWQARFAGDPAIAGGTIRVNRAPFTVVGVAPKGFLGTLRGFAPDLWLPVNTRDADPPALRSTPRLVGLGRLRPGVSAQAAEAEMTVIAQRLTAAVQPEDKRRAAVWVTPENRWMLRQTPQLAFAPAVVVALVGVVLLIACVNLGGLLVARAIFRQKEIALRVSLGASRSDIVRQLLTESLILALLGGAAGVVIALLVLKGLWGWILRILNLRGLFIDTSVDMRMLGFTLAMALVSTLLFGLLPALQASSVEVYESLKGMAAPSRWRVGRSPARTLVACEVALSVVLLVCAGLFVGPLRKASRADLGYPLDGVLLAKINLRAIGHKAVEMVPFYDAVMRRFDGLPGVEAAALAQGPMGGGWPHFLPQSAFPHQERNVVLARVGPAFFRTTRIPLVAGREFDERDKGGPSVAIVSQLVADRQWPGENAVGKLLPVWSNRPPMLVIGVAKTVKTLPVLPAFYNVYLPPWQEPVLDVPMYLHVRTTAAGAADPRFIERELHALKAALPSARIRTLRDRIEEGYSALRLATTILVALGATALLLAAIGLYGLTAYVVGERTYEIGVRRALGAGGVAILQLIIGGTMRLVAIGLAVGLLLAVAPGYAVNVIVGAALEPGVFIGASLLLAATASVAAYLPARRAMAVDPMAALRCE